MVGLPEIRSPALTESPDGKRQLRSLDAQQDWSGYQQSSAVR